MNSTIEQDVNGIISSKIKWDDYRNKKVLITGCNGMIGQYIVYTLIQLNKLYNYNITIYGLCRNKEKAQELFRNEVKLIIQDVEKEITIDDNIDYIVHTASPANPMFYSERPVDTILANTMGTKNTLELARKNNAQYCYISTMEIYGEMDNYYGIKEDEFGRINSLEIRSCYPESKKLGENMCIAYKEQYGVNVKIIRPSYTYGPGMTINDPRVQCEFMKKVLDDEDIVMKSDGSMKRTYTYVADVVAGIFYAILAGKDVVYNVANETAIISIKELAETIINSKPNAKSKVITQIQEQKGWSKVKPKIMNCDRLRNIGWNPMVTVEDGIKKTMEYHITMREENI